MIKTDITARLAELLQQITVANGFRTNIGQNVNVALQRGNEDEAPCVYLIPDEERAELQYGSQGTVASYTISAIVDRKLTSIAEYTDDPTAEWVIVDAIISDIRQAVESRDDEIEGLSESIIMVTATPYFHEDGGKLSGAECIYEIGYAIAPGDPNNHPT